MLMKSAASAAARNLPQGEYRKERTAHMSPASKCTDWSSFLVSQIRVDVSCEKGDTRQKCFQLIRTFHPGGIKNGLRENVMHVHVGIMSAAYQQVLHKPSLH